VELFSACPFAIATLAWEPAPGRRSLCVAVKASFTLAPGGVATLAPLQEPLAADAEVATAVGELAVFKPRADVLIVGHAYAPRGVPAEQLLARARIGTVRKALSITGDRTWVPSFDGLRPSPPVPFRRMPLRYERAVRAGENLGGVDIMSQGAELGRALPNIAAIVDQGGETPGFGPLPLPWRARRWGAGDAAVHWAARSGLAAGPPPAGFDFRILNAAPAEQQLDEIPPGLEIQLENLHPEHTWLETRLPALRVRVFRKAGRHERAAEVPVRCDTLVVDCDRALCTLVWRGAVLVDGPDESVVGRLVIAAEAEGERLGPEHVERLLAQLSPPVTYVEAGPAFGLAPVAEAAPASYPPPAPGTTPPAAGTTPPAAGPEAGGYPQVAQPPAEAGGPRPITLIPRMPGAAAGALPFRPAPTGFEPTPTMSASDSYPPPPAPLAFGAGYLDPALPPPPRPPSWPVHGPADEATHLDEEATPPRGYALAPGAQPERTTVTGTILPPPSAPPPRGGTIRPPMGSAPGIAAASSPEAPMRPTPTPAVPVERTAGGTVRPPPAALPFQRAPLPSFAERPALAVPVLDLPVYAAMKVDLWRGEPLAEVAARHGVELGAFEAHERGQAESIAREAAEGRADGAVAVVEALRAAR
jgi:hypothetical protein